jgi:hypothetical protein
MSAGPAGNHSGPGIAAIRKQSCSDLSGMTVRI